MRENGERGSSLYVEWFWLLLLAGIVSLLFFMGGSLVIEQAVDSYQEKRDVTERNNEKYIAKLQKYVTEHHVSSNDSQKLDAWIQKNRLIYIKVRKDGKWVYDSDFAIDEAEEYELTESPPERCYEVAFRDGTAQVFLMGMYYYNAYVIAMALDTAAAMVLFLTLTMLGIRGKIRYINCLGRDIEILEGGNLEYEVRLQGNDELTDLARGLNAMRISFRHQIREVDSLTKTNQEMVTEISHDLRTPLTSVLLYAEILRSGKCGGHEEQQKYLDKIIRKIQHMKDLSDRLLAFSVSAAQERYAPADYMPLHGGLYEELSDLCHYLEGQGLCVKGNFLWGKGKIYVNEEYLMRILDNVSSNILKYADRQALVLIWDEYYAEEMCITFENNCIGGQSSADSYGIGVRNIQMMMKEMGGSCEVTHSEDTFRICLRFRYQRA